MKTAPAVTVELDKALIVAALSLLLALGWLTGAPIFEPFGRGRLTYLTVLALPILVVVLLLRRTSGDFRNLVTSWWPVVGVLSVYESLKHMHANRITEWLGIQPKDELMLAIDERLFGQALPLYMDSWTAPWFQELMSFFYIWVYYLGPFLLLATAYLLRLEELFRRLRLGIVLGLLGGYALYILVPVAGPLFLIGDQFQHAIPTQSRLETLVFDTLRFNWDCFPSLHTAIPWILTALIWKRLPGWTVALAALLSTGVTLSTVALRFHWGIDLIAAFAWVFLVWLAVEILARHDYGRFLLGVRRARRREHARRSSGRAALRVLGWGAALTSGAAAVSFVALERWVAAWMPAPSLSSAGVAAGALVGLVLGFALNARKVSRHRASIESAALAPLLLAVWLALVGAASETFSIRVWAYASLGLLGPHASGAVGSLVTALWALPPAFFVGWVLRADKEVADRLRLRSPLGPAAIVTLSGAVGGLILVCAWLGPFVGLGDSVQISAVAAAAVALAFRRTARYKAPLRPANLSARSDRFRFDAVVFGAGLAVGPLLPLWAHLYPASMGEATAAFSVTSICLLGGGALAATGQPALERRLPHRRSMLLVVASICLLLAALWTRLPSLFERLAPYLASAISFERLRGAAAIALLLPLGFSVGLALSTLLSGAATATRSRSLALVAAGAALGALSTGTILLPTLGSHVSTFVLPLVLFVLARMTNAQPAPPRQARLLSALAVAALLAAITSPWPSISALVGRHLDPRRSLPPTGALEYLGEDRVAGFVGSIGRAADPAASLVVLGDGLIHARRPSAAELALAAVGTAQVAERSRSLVVGPLPRAARALRRMGFAEVDLVEPSRLLVEAVDRLDGLPLGATPGIRAIVGSPRGLLATSAPYDLVVSHLEDFALGLARMQCSVEFYSLVSRRLTRSGAFVQSIRLGSLGPNELGAMVAALDASFETTTLWVFQDNALLVGSNLSNAAQLAPFRSLELLSDEPGFDALRESGLPQTPLLDVGRIELWLATLAPRVPTDRSNLLALRAPNFRWVRGLAVLNRRFLSQLASIGSEGSASPRLDEIADPIP